MAEEPTGGVAAGEAAPDESGADEGKAGELTFPQAPIEELATLYLEDTDRELPSKIDVRTRYAYFKTIARGGKSIIQSCRDLHLSRNICYKSLRPELKDDAVEQQRFLREARVTAMLQHPSIIPVYELGRDTSGSLYFTMKLVHGYTLREVLEYRDRYDVSQLARVLQQVATALDYAHTVGVAHRDIKPENIIVGPFGEVLLMDWGLAKVWDREGKATSLGEPEAVISDVDASLTGAGKLMGTVAYMSPEQIRKDPQIDPRTDLFSLGTVLFEILTGELPTQGETIDEVLESVLKDNPRRPSEFTKYRVPERLEKICLKLLKKDPDDRYQRARDLVRELEQGW